MGAHHKLSSKNSSCFFNRKEMVLRKQKAKNLIYYIGEVTSE